MGVCVRQGAKDRELDAIILRLALDMRKKERANDLRYVYNITDALGSGYAALAHSRACIVHDKK